MLPYLLLLLPTLLISASPQYVYSASRLWLLLPLLLLFLLRVLLEFVKAPKLFRIPTAWVSLLLRMVATSLYGWLGFRFLESRLTESDWVIQTPLFSIRRLWSSEELLRWVREFHILRPEYPRLPMPAVELLLGSCDHSLNVFRENYCELVLLLFKQQQLGLPPIPTLGLWWAILVITLAFYRKFFLSSPGKPHSLLFAFCPYKGFQTPLSSPPLLSLISLWKPLFFKALK